MIRIFTEDGYLKMDKGEYGVVGLLTKVKPDGPQCDMTIHEEQSRIGVHLWNDNGRVLMRHSCEAPSETLPGYPVVVVPLKSYICDVDPELELDVWLSAPIL